MDDKKLMDDCINFIETKFFNLYPKFREYFSWSKEDIRQELSIVFLKCKSKYNPNRKDKSSFKTYVINSMKNWMIDQDRSTERHKRAKLSLYNGEFGDIPNSEFEKRIEVLLTNDDRPLKPDQMLEIQERLINSAHILDDYEKEVYILWIDTSGDYESMSKYLCQDIKSINKTLEKIIEKIDAAFKN